MPEIPVSLDESISYSFDSSIYSLTLLQKACFKHSDIASYDFKNQDENILVFIYPNKHTNISAESILGIIKNEALDQILREKISQETELERNLILSYAFSNSLLVKN